MKNYCLNSKTICVAIISAFVLMFFVIPGIIFVINKANNMDKNQAIPCAQLLWYFTITDQKNGDTSYESGKWDGGTPNQFMQFGLPIYDSRYDFIEAYQHADSGFVGATNTIIYNISNREYFNEKLIIGKKYSICVDILPYLKKAYLYGAENGAMDNCEWADLVINYMNFGWELPGSFDTSVTVSKLSVKYEEKQTMKKSIKLFSTIIAASILLS